MRLRPGDPRVVALALGAVLALLGAVLINAFGLEVTFW